MIQHMPADRPLQVQGVDVNSTVMHSAAALYLSLYDVTGSLRSLVL